MRFPVAYLRQANRSYFFLREIVVSSPFTRIAVDADVDVALTENNSSTITIEGQPVLAQRIKVENENGVLRIYSRGTVPAKKIKVNIPVQKLESIYVHGDAKVYSTSVLQSDLIEVLIDGECEVRLVSTGEIQVDQANGHKVHFIKNNKILVIPGSDVRKEK